MPRTIKYILSILFLLIAVSPVSAAKKVYNILYVQSYTEWDTWSKELNRGVREGFSDSQISVNVVTEYINSRHWNSVAEEEIMRRICRRADNRGTDLIMVSNDEAFYSLMACGDSLPKNVPIVFFGVEFPNEELMSKYPNATGLLAPPAFDKLLEVAKQVFPERKNVMVISESTILGRKGREAFRLHWNEFVKQNPDYSLKEFDITHDPMTTIVGRIHLSSIANKSIVVVPYWGLFMSSIAKVSKSPTFTVSSSSLMQGGFGAITPDAYKDGKAAAKIACRILSGTLPTSIPIGSSNYEMTFDNKQLKFFNVSKDRIPKSGVIINQTYIEKYGLYLILFYGLILSLLVLLVVRLITVNRRESRRRMHAQTRLLIQGRLVEQRNEFDNVFHSIRDAVITYDNDFRIHFVNHSAIQMVGLFDNTDDAMARPYEGQMAGEICKLYNNGEEVLLQLLKKVGATGESLEIPENSYVKSLFNNKFFPVSGEIVPIRSQGKRTGVALSFRNISVEALQKRFFNLAVEESSIYPWQYDLETDSFSFLGSYISRMGFKDLIVSRKDIENRMHPEDYSDAHAMFEDLLQNHKQNTRISFRMLNGKNVYEWWEYRIMVLRGVAPEEEFNVIGVCQSIQQYKNTEEELIIARDKALQTDKLKSAFLANMSHEIRTPLNAIVGFSDLLKDIKMFSEEEVNHFITTINKNCNLLLALISDVLDLSRVESGTMDFQLSPYYLPIILQEVYDSQRLNMPEGVELIREIPQGNEKTIVTDPVRLKQILNNLINNAVKFTTKGSITFGYTEQKAGYTLFYVRDTGKGISKEDQERIFERFYKADSFTQGAGLGLSICQTIVGKLHGKIWVESQEGMGTTFYVHLPDKGE